MAKIASNSEEKVFRIGEWLGMNENPDGDTRLRLGEAAVMRNFKVTRDKSLQKRPGLNALAFVVQYYKWFSTDEYTKIETTAPQLEVFMDATVDRMTGEVTLGEQWMLPSDFDGTRYREDQNVVILSDGRCCSAISCRQNSTTGKYEWTMLVIRVGLLEMKKPVQDLWSGYVGGKYRLVGAVNGHLAELHNGDEFVFRYIGYFGGVLEGKVSLFGFSDTLYICSSGPGSDVRYLYWDGVKDSIEPVEGYWPVVAVSISPEKGTTPEGSLLERVNLMTNIRKVWLSPESDKGQVYVLPENATRIQYVKSLVNGDVLSSSNYKIMNISWNGHTRVGLFFGDTDSAGAFLENNYGINTIEVCYAAPHDGDYGLAALFPEGSRISVEQYNGTSDSRLFLCSDQSNKVYYSGLDYNGKPRADYFPDLNEISVGESSDTVTGMIRHYSRLIVYKANSTYSIQYGTIGLADGTTTAAFYCTPVNKRIGNDAFGQVRLVLNSPRTLHGNDLYEWRNNSSYSSNLTVDERQAKRISDRIHRTLSSFDFSKCYCYDDNDNQEYYICFDKMALVHNYAVDAWYYYDNFDVVCMVNFQGELYAGDSQGRFNLVSRTNRTDNGEEITAYWESGSEAFGKEFMRKYSSTIWVTLKPENRSRVVVTAVTDRNGNLEEDVLAPPLTEYTIAASLATFSDADFRAWSFNTSRVPKIFRSKLKAKKFVYYKLIFKQDGTDTTATIVSADIKIRFTGQAR